MNYAPSPQQEKGRLRVLKRKLENGLVSGPWTLFTLYQEYGSWETTQRTDFARERFMQMYGSKNCRMDLEEMKLVSCIVKIRGRKSSSMIYGYIKYKD